MIDFQKIDVSRAQEYRTYLSYAADRGCSYSFANLYMWGRQGAAVVEGQLALFSHFSGHTLYPFPAGPGDAKPVLDAIIADAHQRGIPCRLTGMTRREQQLLDEYYPGRFCFHCDRDSFDYVYDINDLADLRGRKFQQKRNHLHRFEERYPDFHVKPLDESNLSTCRNMTDNWYYRRMLDNPHEDLHIEQVALRRALDHYRQLGMEGLVLYAGGQVAAVTMATFLSEDTMDVHFEKAIAEIPEAYAAINREFARYIRAKYPQVKYLNREDDMGNPGLRKAKLSYQPHHIIEKGWAHLIVEEYDD